MLPRVAKLPLSPTRRAGAPQDTSLGHSKGLLGSDPTLCPPPRDPAVAVTPPAAPYLTPTPAAAAGFPAAAVRIPSLPFPPPLGAALPAGRDNCHSCELTWLRGIRHDFPCQTRDGEGSRVFRVVVVVFFFLTIFVSPHCSVVHCSLLWSNLRGNCANEEGEHVHQTLPLLSRDVQSPASPTHLPACLLPAIPPSCPQRLRDADLVPSALLLNLFTHTLILAFFRLVSCCVAARNHSALTLSATYLFPNHFLYFTSQIPPLVQRYICLCVLSYIFPPAGSLTIFPSEAQGLFCDTFCLICYKGFCMALFSCKYIVFAAFLFCRLEAFEELHSI